MPKGNPGAYRVFGKPASGLKKGGKDTLMRAMKKRASKPFPFAKKK